MANVSSAMPPESQYEALRTGCGVMELAGWSSVTLTGADRQTFLNNFSTNNVNRLVPGTTCETFFTNVKGKIISHGLVICRDEEMAVIMVPGQAATLVEHLDQYLIREEVTLADTSAERAHCLAAGDRTRDIAAEAEPAVEVPLWVANWDIAAGRSALVIESRPDAAARLRQALAERGAVACGDTAWQTARIEWGLPLFGVDFNEDNFPQEVNRNERAISFTKGCYLGQETIARIDALGHVNRQLVGVRFSAADVPEAGTPLFRGDVTVGRVSSAAYSPRLGAPLALAMVRSESTAPGSRLQSPAGECEVVALPASESQ